MVKIIFYGKHNYFSDTRYDNKASTAICLDLWNILLRPRFNPISIDLFDALWYGGGHNVPTDIKTFVKPHVFVQIKSNKSRKVEQGLIFNWKQN